MTSNTPSKDGFHLTDEEFEQLLKELREEIEQEDKEATEDDFFDPSVWSAWEEK